MEHIKRMISLSKYRSIWLVSLIAFLIVLIHASVAVSFPDDPIPTLDFGESEKSIIVRLQFSGPLEAQIESVKVVPGPSHGWAGDPPLLRVELLDLDSDVIMEFNAWNPLFSNYQDASGNDRGVILEEASGNFPFPFSSNVATMNVSDVETEQEIISVDLIPALHDYCDDNADDPDCENVVNRPPECNANGPYEAECAGSTTNVALDGTGSTDLDGDPLSYSWSTNCPGGSFDNATSPTPNLTVDTSFGTTIVCNSSLQVDDGYEGSDNCSRTVTIRDTTQPYIQCSAPATITPPDAPISFTATATDICTGDPSVEIIGYDCFKFTKKGKKIDKTMSCIVEVNGDTITIVDSGGVDDNITWTVRATDNSGNVSESTCSVVVLNPAKHNR